MTAALDRLLAESDIRQLVARYAFFLDNRELDKLVNLFIPNVQTPGGETGREALRDSFIDQLAPLGATILNIGTHQIDLHGPNKASGLVYCKAEIESGVQWIHQAIRYDDTYRRINGRWFFETRKHQLFYGSEVGQNPLLLESAHWPDHHIGRGTLPQEEPAWQTFVNSQLPEQPTSS